MLFLQSTLSIKLLSVIKKATIIVEIIVYNSVMVSLTTNII